MIRGVPSSNRVTNVIMKYITYYQKRVQQTETGPLASSCTLLTMRYIRQEARPQRRRKHDLVGGHYLLRESHAAG